MKLLIKKMAEVVFVSLALLFVSCGKQVVDYNSEENITENTSIKNGVYSDIGTNINDKGIWDEEIHAKEGADIARIYAQVHMPATDAVNVVETMNLDITEAFIEKWITEFSEGDVYYADDAHMPKYMVEEYVASIKDRIAEAEEMKAELGDVWEEIYGADLYDTLGKWEDLLETAPADWVKVTNYKAYDYLITHMGMEYVISFRDQDSPSENQYGTCVTMQVNGRNENAIQCTGSSVAGNVDNRCNISQEEAEKIAISFANEIGDGTFQVVLSETLEWYTMKNSEVDECWYDGYYFKLYRCLDDMLVEGEYLNSGNSHVEMETSAEDLFEYINVAVNADGIVDFEYCGAKVLGDVLAEKANMLPLDKVQGAIRNIIAEKVDAGAGYYDFFGGTMEMFYFPVRDAQQTGRFTLVPSWRITENKIGEFAYGTGETVYINGIDGSEMFSGGMEITVESYED